MKKLSSFFLLAGLLMVTLFVFASGKKFASALDLYADKGGGVYVQITDGEQDFLELSTSPGSGSPTQAAIRDRSNQTFPLVAGPGKVPVYSVTAW